VLGRKPVILAVLTFLFLFPILAFMLIDTKEPFLVGVVDLRLQKDAVVGRIAQAAAHETEQAVKA